MTDPEAGLAARLYDRYRKFVRDGEGQEIHMEWADVPPSEIRSVFESYAAEALAYVRDVLLTRERVRLAVLEGWNERLGREGSEDWPWDVADAIRALLDSRGPAK